MCAEGRRLEYQVLRAEILHSDRTCLTIVGLLLGTTGAVLALTMERSTIEIAALLSPLWIIGWCYVTEKRFMIRRTSYYLRHEVESEVLGLGWQRWLGQSRSELDRHFPRFDPYLLETSLTFVVTVSIPGYLLLGYGEMVFSIPFFVCSALALVLIALMACTLPKYLKHHSRFDDAGA